MVEVHEENPASHSHRHTLSKNISAKNCDVSVIPLSRAGLQLLAGPQHTCTEAWETNRVAKGAEPRVLLILHHTASSSTLNETTDFCYLSKDILKCDGHYFYCGCLVRKDIRVGQAGGCYF